MPTQWNDQSHVLLQVPMACCAMGTKYSAETVVLLVLKVSLLLTMATFGAFTEGMQLFASFAILLNLPRRGLMKGMGQIITWSVRDETLHCISMIRLFRTLLGEFPKANTKEEFIARIQAHQAEAH